MTQAELTQIAEKVVAHAQRALPEQLRTLAGELPVVYHDFPSDEILGEEFEPDILGMFAGSPHNEDTGDRNDVPPHIMLFLGNLWDYAEGDSDVYREEVRLTYLHELGHYFGWDEDDLDMRGLA
jgi:predicted Zn-dependent protease with MMP-like domain